MCELIVEQCPGPITWSSLLADNGAMSGSHNSGGTACELIVEQCPGPITWSSLLADNGAVSGSHNL